MKKQIDPEQLLPQEPGDKGAIWLDHDQKSLLNQFFQRAKYKHTHYKEQNYTEWSKSDRTYRIYHSWYELRIVLLSGNQEVGTEIAPVADTRQILPEIITSQVDLNLPNLSLRYGMYVRVPFPPNQEGGFRDFSIGRVSGFNKIADTVVVSLEYYISGDAPVTHTAEWPRYLVQRCHILPQTIFTHVPTGQTGTVLAVCNSTWHEGEYCDYYVWLNGYTTRLPEHELLVPGHRGDPDPSQQLTNYELNNPIFKFYRDLLVESYAELQSATYGMEDLIGSRVILLPHQADVVTRVLSDNQCRYILADEVGLGKTIEACVILKGLRRRHLGLKALIITPPSLTKQWYNELDQKFWLHFASFQDAEKVFKNPDAAGLIISTERLIADTGLTRWVKGQPWGLLIIDEAHHIHKRPELFQHVFELSQLIERALILSATPIQRRAEEFLALLQLMNPGHYGYLTPAAFQQMLDAQYRLLPLIASIAHDLTPEYFDNQFFLVQMKDVLNLLPHDTLLKEMVDKAAHEVDELDQGLSQARDAIAYISENY
ncbi:MAG: SNF2-related protein, partial [Nitrososphaera sp.]|nr:SNF2-related protein [Nitrososphaera sp.]